MEIDLNKFDSIKNIENINFLLENEVVIVPINCFEALRVKVEKEKGKNVIKEFHCNIINNGEVSLNRNKLSNPIDTLNTNTISYIEIVNKDNSKIKCTIKNYNNNAYDLKNNYNQKSELLNYKHLKLDIVDNKYLPITDVLKQLEYILEDIPVTDEEGEEYIVTTLNSDKVLCTKDLSPIALSLEILQKRFYIEEVNPFEIK